MFGIGLVSLGSFINLSPQFIITMTRFKKKSFLMAVLYGCLTYLDKK